MMNQTTNLRMTKTQREIGKARDGEESASETICLRVAFKFQYDDMPDATVQLFILWVYAVPPNNRLLSIFCSLSLEQHLCVLLMREAKWGVQNLLNVEWRQFLCRACVYVCVTVCDCYLLVYGHVCNSGMAF